MKKVTFKNLCIMVAIILIIGAAVPTATAVSGAVGAVSAFAGAIGGFSGYDNAEYRPGMFSDVDENQWYGANSSAVIKAAYELQIMSGKGGGIFDPDGDITRAEAIKMAAVVHEIYNGGDESAFKTSTPWYREYVTYAVSRGLIDMDPFDVDPGEYDTPATRAEMAYIFARAVPDDELSQINVINQLPDIWLNDAPPMRSYSAEVYKLYRAGVLSGNDSRGTFNPYSNVTRAEAAAIICRIVLPQERVALDLSRVALRVGIFGFDPTGGRRQPDTPPLIEDCEVFIDVEDIDYSEMVFIATNMDVSSFKYIHIEFDDSYMESNVYSPFRIVSELYTMDYLTPERPFAVQWVDVGVIPHRGVSFVDDKGVTRYFSMSYSGYDGSFLLNEFIID